MQPFTPPTRSASRLRSISLSVIALTALALAAGPTQGALLDLDINGFRFGPSTETQSGFDDLVVKSGDSSPVSGTFGTIDVTITSVDASTNSPTFVARNRERPNDDGSISEGNLHRDWIRGGNDNGDSTLGDEGLDILVEGLPPNSTLPVTIWSYEAGSSGTTGAAGSLSDWFADDGDGSFSSGSDTLAQDNWEVIAFSDFDEDSDGRFTITGTTNSAGELRIFGRGGGAAGTSDSDGRGDVFLNGIQIIPEPATVALLGLGGAVMLTGRKRRGA